MMFSDWIIAASWLVFIAYWLISARGVKRNIGSRPWKREIWLRVASSYARSWYFGSRVCAIPSGKHSST